MQYKLTLPSKKVVVMREMKIKDLQLAAELTRDGASAAANETKLQNEIIKMLVVSVNGQALTANAKEDLDANFNMQEYIALKLFIQEQLGNAQKATVEMVTD